jgi:hypothetical protein
LENKGPDRGTLDDALELLYIYEAYHQSLRSLCSLTAIGHLSLEPLPFTRPVM